MKRAVVVVGGMVLSAICLATALYAAPQISFPGSTHYFWKTSPANEGAEFVTLFCHSCEDATGSGRDIPLVTVLRDTLGDSDIANDRVTYVWLLTYSRPSWEKQALSAVPFLYWKIGDGKAKLDERDPKPLLSLVETQHSVVYSATRTVIQWSVLDPLSRPVRATTRAYQTNRVDHERLHLEEAQSYLQSAPADDDGAGLTSQELNTVIARLELRKRMLGGLVSERRAATVGADAALEQERVRTRNWELLRQWSDKTGLAFEPIDLAGAKGQYAVVWFPVSADRSPRGTALGPIWKLFNLKDPYTDREKVLSGTHYQRTLNGVTAEYVPLGAYSLIHPRVPLLLVDFRGGGHLRRHELTQRAINEITSGVIGLSRITNWYYFVAADVYDFYMTRRGTAMNRAQRLDSYSRFRVALALDSGLDPVLRKAMQQRIDNLATNPLESSPADEMKAAEQRYSLLLAGGGDLNRRLQGERRGELARFEASGAQRIRDNALHYVTLGMYTHRSKSDSELMARLDLSRRATYYLNFLDTLAAAGTDPTVAYEPSRIQTAVSELSSVVPQIGNLAIRDRAEKTLLRVRSLASDLALRADCSVALDSIRGVGGETPGTGASFAGGESVDLLSAPEPLQ